MKKIIVWALLLVMLLGLLAGCKGNETPDPTKATDATQATEATDATDATEGTEATDATEETEATDATEATVPSDVNTIVDAASALAEGKSLPYKPTLSGEIVSVDVPFEKETMKITVTMKVDGTEGKTLSCCIGGSNGDKLGVGDMITMTGAVKNENGTIGFAYGSNLDSWEAALRYGHSIAEDFTFGDSLVVFGDSITQGVSVNEKGQGYFPTPYINLLRDKIGTITTYENRGLTSTYICDTANGDSIYNRVLKLTGEYDSVFIAGGINDFVWGKPLGNVDDTEPTSFYGCLEKMCAFLEENHPNSKVVFMTPLVDALTVDATLYKTANAYRNAIHEVALRHGFNVVEGSLMGISGMKNDLVWDGIHPSTAGHELLCEKLYELLCQ